MKLHRFSALFLAPLALYAASASLAWAQQPVPPAAPLHAVAATAEPTTVAALAAEELSHAPKLTESTLRQTYVGKTVFLRGCYVGDNLNFDEYGKVKGNPKTQSFTLSALEIKKVSLDKDKLQITADRYALHFFGVLPYEQSTKRSFDKVRISKKPVHITISRERVVKPKKKKEKKKKEEDAKKAGVKAGVKAGGVEAAKAAPTAPEPLPKPKPGTTYSPAHSSMMMEHALSNVFATRIDSKMIAAMPPYWQRYFASKRDHKEFMPSNPDIMQVGDGVSAPKLLNGLDPSSNSYAQKFGVAGLTLFRTVIDASGKPVKVAIARPIGFGLDENAVNAIKRSHFKPAMKDGHPVPVVTDLVVTFRIFSNRTKPGSVRKGEKLTEVVASAWDPVSPAPSEKKK